MTDPNDKRSRPLAGELLGRAGWLGVLDDLQGGLNHSLNGRLSSLDGLLQIIALDGLTETPVTDMLQSETKRLAETIRILRLMGGDVEGPPEPLAAGDLVADAEALHGHRRQRFSVETETSLQEALPPFRANRARILRLLLIALNRAVRRASDMDEGHVRLRATAEEDRVRFTVTWDGAVGTLAEHDATLDLEALDELAALDAGGVQPERSGITLWLPALLRPGA